MQARGKPVTTATALTEDEADGPDHRDPSPPDVSGRHSVRQGQHSSRPGHPALYAPMPTLIIHAWAVNANALAVRAMQGRDKDDTAQGSETAAITLAKRDAHATRPFRMNVAKHSSWISSNDLQQADDVPESTCARGDSASFCIWY